MVQVASIGNNITVQIAASISAKVGAVSAALACPRDSVQPLFSGRVLYMQEPWAAEEDPNAESSTSSGSPTITSTDSDAH